MKGTVLAFSGRIASGKTALSEQVALSLGWPRVAFGDYVRSVAQSRQLPESRAELQALGATLIEEQGWEQFCRSVLGQANWKPGMSLVIDGIRHAEAVSALRLLVAPAEVLLVLIQADTAIRAARLAERGMPGDESLERMDTHSTEVQLGTVLPHMADLTVDGTRSLQEVVPMIVEWIRRRQLAAQAVSWRRSRPALPS